MALIKKLIKQLLSLPWVWRHSFFLRQSGVVVLMYHRVSDRQTPFAAFPLALFKQQMQWLQAHCTVIAETDYLACLSRKNDRRKPVVMITFDFLSAIFLRISNKGECINHDLVIER